MSIQLQVVLGAYAAIFYLPMQMLTWHNWVIANDVMMFVGLFVIAFMIAALPWQRRQWPPPAAAASQGRARLRRSGGLAPARSGDPRTAVPGIQASSGADASSIKWDTAAPPLPCLDPTDP